MVDNEIDRHREGYIKRREYMDLRMNRMMNTMKSAVLVYGVIGVFIFLWISAWPPIKNILNAKHEIMQAEVVGYKKIPNLDLKIATIEKQMVALTTENIEARLHKIETAIKAGEVKTEDLKSLQQLRDDFAVMKTYMFADPDQLVELKSLQRDYADLHDALQKLMNKEDILREIDSVRNLFYATLGACGILVSIFAGAWFVAFRQRTKFIQVDNAQQDAGE